MAEELPQTPKGDDSDSSMIFIRSWPKEPGLLEHSFDDEKPCPVNLSFNSQTAAAVQIQTTEKTPVHLDMGMQFVASQDIPICIKMCEPITAKSEYEIGIVLFDRPLATLSIRGTTRLFNSRQPQ